MAKKSQFVVFGKQKGKELTCLEILSHPLSICSVPKKWKTISHASSNKQQKTFNYLRLRYTPFYHIFYIEIHLLCGWFWWWYLTHSIYRTSNNPVRLCNCMHDKQNIYLFTSRTKIKLNWNFKGMEKRLASRISVVVLLVNIKHIKFWVE